MKPKKMTISKFAKNAGVNIETIRYYHRLDVLPLPDSQGSGYREYDADTWQRLRFIQHAQLAGFTLKEIKKLIDADPILERPHIQIITKDKIAALHVQIKKLKKIHAALQQWLDECESLSDEVCCPIIKALNDKLGNMSI